MILITGAASGIGENVAYQYAQRDCRLVLTDINEAELARVQHRCEEIMQRRTGGKETKEGGKEWTMTSVLDVTDEAACRRVVNTAVERFGSLDILVLCAGLGAHHTFSNTHNLAIFRKLMEVNFFGYLYCLHAAYPHLERSRGLCIAITSFSGEVGLPYRTAYCASKFAVTGLLESLRAEMKVLQMEKEKNKNSSSSSNNNEQNKRGGEGEGLPFDITIVCPPTINTNLRKNSLTTDPHLKDAPSKDSLSVEQCAAVVVDAGDRRLRKAFFPFKSFVASYLRPLVPDAMDALIMARAKL